jgi:hypothetical protein
MRTLETETPLRERKEVAQTPRADYALKAYRILYFGFIAAPFLAGLDKFFNFMVNWTQYLSPIISNNIDAHAFMRLVGIVEMVAAVIIALRPRIGGLIVAFWLWGIIINLLSIPGYYDIALRDFGLSLGALSLSFLARAYRYYP